MLPTVILPKVSLVGFRASCPVATAVPTPVSGMLSDGFEALLVTASVPLNVPTVFGEKVILIVALCPARIAVGNVGDVNAKFWLEMVALLTVTDKFPVFVAVNVKVLLLPAETLPKSRPEVAIDKRFDCC